MASNGEIYRQRLKATLGDDGAKEKLKKYMKEYRAKKKAQIDINELYLTKAKEEKKAEKTIKINLARIKNIYEGITDTPYYGVMEELKTLKNYNKITAYIDSKDWSDSTKGDNYGSLIAFIRTMKGANKTIINRFDKKMRAYKNKREAKYEDNEYKAEEKIDINELMELWENGARINIKNELIIALFLLQPTRRRNVYKDMIITTKEKPEDINQLIIDKKTNKPLYFIFKDYKTKKYIGNYKLNINEDIADFIEDYITEYKKKDGDLLFTNKDGNQYTDGSYQYFITQSMKKAFNKHITVNQIRHAKLSALDTNKLTVNELQKIANDYGQLNIRQTLKYRTLNEG